MHRRTARVALIVIAAVVSSAAAAQQRYPVRPVRLILPFTAGSAVDVLGRLYAQHMSEGWSQQVVVDNRPGANGIIGMELIARAPADGYTIGMGNVATLAINASMYAKLPYDSLRDYAPVSYTAAIANCLIVHPSLPAKSVNELVALAKSRPGQLNYGSGGVGSAQHIPMELFKAMTGVNVVHVAYKGITPAFNDLLAGQVPMVIASVANALPHHRTGRLRILGTTGLKRTSATPDIPTIAESVPGYEGDSWTGIIAPAGTPAEVVARLNAAAVRVSQLAEVREKLSALGFEVVGSPAEVLAAKIRDDTARIGKVVREAGIRAE